MGCACARNSTAHAVKPPREESSKPKLITNETTMSQKLKVEEKKREEDDIAAEASDFLSQIYMDAEKKISSSAI
ncbi:unnamed protein product [Blepharisma stoltei]|uniref:Uncharacterized protein n=1 Tax=Blepharisma stoltei TaxID=1481888 RepID=A0AAU9JNI4_9CILI|nr:unnamed protein product [Blepharisma stoltei]